MDSGTVMILIVLVALPIGAVIFAMGAGNALSQIGKGDLAIDPDSTRGTGGSVTPPATSGAVREEEIRQMVEARSYRREARGESPLDVDAEVEKLLAPLRGVGLGGDESLRDEVRQLVIARNDRRERQGKKPLDVEEEIDRQLRELENLGH